MAAPALTGIRQDRPTVSPHGSPPLPVLEAEEPQPRTPWVKWIVVLVVLGVLAAGAYWLFFGRTPPADPAAGKNRDRPVPVVAAKSVVGDLPVYLTGLGTVTPLNSVVLRTRVDGQLIQVKFTEDQEVHVNDVLAQIDPEPFNAQIAQAKGQLAKDTALMENAAQDVIRYTNAGESVSKQQLQTAEATRKQYEGAIEADKGMLRNATLQLEWSTIKSPIDGRIGFRSVDQGNIVHANDTNGLAIINQIKPITVVFALPQDEIRQLRRRMAQVEKNNQGKNKGEKDWDSVKVDAFDRDLKTKLATGELLAVDNQVDPNSGTIRIKAKYENLNNELYPNQYVNARLLVDTRKNAVLIPPTAVQRGPDNKPFVYVIKKDQTVEVRKNIKLGETEGDRTIVKEGLKPGEWVVTDGVDKLVQGSKVINSSEKNPLWTGATRPAGEMSDEPDGFGSTRPGSRPGPGTRPAAPGEEKRSRGEEESYGGTLSSTPLLLYSSSCLSQGENESCPAGVEA